MALGTSDTGVAYVELSPALGHVFSDADRNDVLLYTGTRFQNVLFGHSDSNAHVSTLRITPARVEVPKGVGFPVSDQIDAATYQMRSVADVLDVTMPAGLSGATSNPYKFRVGAGMEVFNDGSVGIGHRTDAGVALPRAALDVRGDAVLGSGAHATGPYMVQRTWGAAAATHHVTFAAFATPGYVTGSCSGQLTLHLKGSADSKAGTAQVSYAMTTASGVATMDVCVVNKHASANVGAFDVTVDGVGARLVVQTDSDCALCWSCVGAA